MSKDKNVQVSLVVITTKKRARICKDLFSALSAYLAIAGDVIISPREQLVEKHENVRGR